MEPKSQGLIEEEFVKLEDEVMEYFNYQNDLANAKDDTERKLLEMEPVGIPEPLVYLKRMRLLGFIKLLPGEYLDQPYLTFRQFEICIRQESKLLAATL